MQRLRFELPPQPQQAPAGGTDADTTGTTHRREYPCAGRTAIPTAPETHLHPNSPHPTPSDGTACRPFPAATGRDTASGIQASARTPAENTNRRTSHCRTRDSCAEHAESGREENPRHRQRPTGHLHPPQAGRRKAVRTWHDNRPHTGIGSRPRRRLYFQRAGHQLLLARICRPDAPRTSRHSQADAAHAPHPAERHDLRSCGRQSHRGQRIYRAYPRHTAIPAYTAEEQQSDDDRARQQTYGKGACLWTRRTVPDDVTEKQSLAGTERRVRVRVCVNSHKLSSPAGQPRKTFFAGHKPGVPSIDAVPQITQPVAAQLGKHNFTLPVKHLNWTHNL